MLDEAIIYKDDSIYLNADEIINICKKRIFNYYGLVGVIYQKMQNLAEN